MTLPKIPSPDVGKLAKELRSGHRAALARAITLIESRRGDHQAAARDLVQALLPDTGTAVRDWVPCLTAGGELWWSLPGETELNGEPLRPAPTAGG